MKKFIKIQTLSITLFFLFSSTLLISSPKKNNTFKFAGTYKYSTNTEIGSVKEAKIYPESDSTVLIYICIVTKNPGNNLGDIFTRIKIVDGKGEYFRVDNEDTNKIDNCRFNIKFQNDGLIIDVPNHETNECGFGHNAFLEGEYKRKSKKIPEYFIDFCNEKRYFKTATPEENQALQLRK